MTTGNPPLGSFEEQVLVAVLRARGEGSGEAYGMGVRREIEDATGREVSIGAVYATLDRLEAKGLLASSRASVDGQSRRVFAVPRAGLLALAETRAMRERLWRGVDLDALLAAAG